MFTATPPGYPPLRRHSDATTTHHYPEGSIVEVQTKNGNSKGAYFLATVLPFPAHHSSTQNQQLYVKYHNILAENAAASEQEQRLKEYADVSSLRPAPSPQEIAAGVGINDVVDAFGNGGWWTGVVQRVVESGNRFVVSFDDSSESREFRVAQLRVHWDWVSGSWARPEKQAVVASMYEVGERMEASFDNGEPHYSWSMVKVVGKPKGGRLWVENCITTRSSTGRRPNTTVDLANVRPCPPALVYESFVVGDVIDAYFDFRWWKGVISKVNVGCKYDVHFERMITDKVFHQSKLRMHMEWRDQKWFVSPQVESTRVDTGDSCAERQSGKSLERLVENLETPAQCVLLTCEFVTTAENGDSSGQIQKEKSPERLLEGAQAPAAGIVPKSDGKPVEVIDLDSEDEDLDTQLLPFYKTSPLWKTIESMDVFKRLPQNPHFQPLEQYQESTREGHAIALMVTFTNVVKQVTSLKCSDPNGITDDISDTLEELEKHGFDVAALQECVIHLVGLREKRECYVKDANEVESQLLVLTKGKGDAAEEINGIKAEIEKLKAKLSLDQMAKRSEESELAALQARRQEVKESMLALLLEFDNMACMKW